MRLVGLLLVAVGLGLLLFVGVTFFQDSHKVLSPVPEQSGVKVIFVTPTP